MRTIVHPGRTLRIEPQPRTSWSRRASLAAHLGWFAAGSVLGFAVPFVFISWLALQHDVYYAVYFAVALVFLAAYVRATDIDLGGLFGANWRWSLALAVPATVFVVANVLSRDGTPGPSGAYAVFEAGWRGLAYGVVDALLLTAFPAAVAFSLLSGRLAGLGRRVLFGAIMLPLVVVITGMYHLGYEQFREDGILAPETGNAVISLPALVTGNPLGSVVAHASMHLAADVHSYETDVFLPPETGAP